ncbi:MAG: transcriptional repressor [Cyclobacteriaceae bacterium]|nr:transcriptional repressor [Cyclobacteriaceae bacterium]
MAEQETVIRNAKSIFEDFLLKNNYRKTAERFYVIDELYILEDHIDVDSLYLIMKNKKYSISRATIYNTLDLLVDCGLAVKHQFGDKSALYEQALTYKHHDHLVCNQCSKIKEFSDPKIEEIKNSIGRALDSKVTNHSLVFHGDCIIPNCENKK